MKYKFIIPCEIYDVHCFAIGDIVSVCYVNVSADDVVSVCVQYENSTDKKTTYHIPIKVFQFCTEKINDEIENTCLNCIYWKTCNVTGKNYKIDSCEDFLDYRLYFTKGNKKICAQCSSNSETCEKNLKNGE